MHFGEPKTIAEKEPPLHSSRDFFFSFLSQFCKNVFFLGDNFPYPADSIVVWLLLYELSLDSLFR